MTKALVLKGLKVLITRTEKDSRQFADMLIEYGALPITVPLVGFQGRSLTAEMKLKLSSLNKYGWIVFTSKNGVNYFFDHVHSRDLPKIASIGDKTTNQLEIYGVTPHFSPSQFVAEIFIEEFIPVLNEKSKVLVVKGNLARSLISETLNESGHDCDEIILYDNVMPSENEMKLKDAVQLQELDVITFASSSAIHNFMKIIKKYHLETYIERTVFACIGPIAERTAVQYGLNVQVCAKTYTMSGLFKSLLNQYT